MSNFYFPEGTKVYFSTTLAAAKTVTGITNANPAVATSTAHGFTDGDELLYEGGWGDINGMIFKADELSANTVGLVDLDTTDTQWFPAGSGVGTLKKISNWIEIPDLLTLGTDGGDVRYTDIPLLSRRQDVRRATGFNSSSMPFTMVWDPDNASYRQMLAISRTLRSAAMKIVVGGGAAIYGYGGLNVREAPTFNRNQVMEVGGALTIDSRIMAYPA